jgi:hypothetical protein
MRRLHIKLQECTAIAKALLRENSLKFGGIGIEDCEDRRIPIAAYYCLSFARLSLAWLFALGRVLT